MNTFVKAVIENRAVYNRLSEPVTLAAPFPLGKIRDSAELAVIEIRSGKRLLSDATVTGRWHDGTIRWMVLTVLCTIDAKTALEVGIIEKSSVPMSGTGSTQQLFGFIGAELGGPKNTIGSLIENGGNRTLSVRCTGIDNTPIDFALFSHMTEISPVKKTTELKFRGEVLGNSLVELIVRVYDFYAAGIVRIDSTIKNRNASRHANEFWDLGDPGSFVFGGLSLELELFKTDKYGFSLDSSIIEAERFGFLPFTLLQQSSGGENWNSTNHVAAGGTNYRVKKGAVIQTGEDVTECNRITPSVFIHSKTGIAAITLTEFWENFPSSLAVTGSSGQCTIGLFPCQNTELYELQGGEQKTQTIFYRQSSTIESSSVLWAHDPLIPIIQCEWYIQCGVYPYLTAPDKSDPKEYSELINRCIDETTGFSARREIIDEYGWRNFGEMYADHESSYLDKGTYNISHYNNQYDFMYYAMVHFWRSSDVRWYRLADELARHVRDIDIYHTARDRFVFNGGIYWHTNHYVNAETATHRCFSVKCSPSVPGGLSVQNCYFSGLITYYYRTADPEMKESVYGVMEYVRRLVMGPDHFFKKVSYRVVEHIKHVVYRIHANRKKQIYPFGLFHGPSRESGNALLALIRSYEFTYEKKYLVAAEWLIRKCINPRQNLFSIKLDEPEFRWMYLLFLQSLVAYLALKEKCCQKDKMYYYALESFMHYIRWMAVHEYSYLDKPEKLEFVNETWAMQELRKPHLFYEAANRANTPEERACYIKKAEYFEERAYYHFNLYGERTSLTRPLVLAAAYGLIPHYFRGKNK